LVLQVLGKPFQHKYKKIANFVQKYMFELCFQYREKKFAMAILQAGSGGGVQGEGG